MYKLKEKKEMSLLCVWFFPFFNTLLIYINAKNPAVFLGGGFNPLVNHLILLYISVYTQSLHITNEL
jgi:hypothetical protein